MEATVPTALSDGRCRLSESKVGGGRFSAQAVALNVQQLLSDGPLQALDYRPKCPMYVPPALRVDFADVSDQIARAAVTVRSAEATVAMANRLGRIAADLRRQEVVLRACHDQISATVRDRDKEHPVPFPAKQ